MIRGGTLVLVAALLLAGIPAGGIAPAAGADAGSEFVPGTQVEADRISMRAEVAENGTATWTIDYRIRLATENETAAFEDLQEDIRRNTSAYVDEFAVGIDATVASAENRTGREMTTSGFGVETSVEQVPREYGVVEYRFRWDGFAAVGDDRIAAGDALSGLFLDESTRLTVAGPSGYAPSEVSPEESATVGDGSVAWSGPLEFGTGEPTLVFTPGTTTSAADGTSPGGNSTLLVLLAAALVAATVAATVAVVVYRRSESSEWPIGAPAAESDEDDDRGDGDSSSESSPDEGGSPAPAAAGAGAGAESDAEDEELLSNEERVLRLLSERGGRAKQQEVVSALDWTEAKTSQVVNDMHESGRIEKFRIGRENVLKLPDEDAESE